jgi:aminopeptidase N
MGRPMPTDAKEESPYRPFQPTPVEPKYGRDRGFAVTHTRLDLTIDQRTQTVSGAAQVRIQPFSNLREFELDAEDLDVRRVEVDGKAATHESHQRKLLIRPARALKEGQTAEVLVEYRARPRRGLYFVQPSKLYPKKPIQAWSQGESEDNHAWFPGYDHPNNKATSEVLLTVRDPLVAISNGHLEGRRRARPGWTQYHWVQDVPQPNYLIAVVVGRFDEIQAKWRSVPLSYFVPVGKRAWGQETFKHTPEVLEFFSRVTDYPYPFPKYAQAIVADFMWGGMENTTITTVNERFLIGPEHRHDANPDGLIAHEAAHQWFGDLITTKTWDHLWLNEGFATYFDALFHEHHYGREWFHVEMMDNAGAYFAEDGERYRRPIVTRDYLEPEDLFDRHTYQKGACVLHMLRKELGDDAWWKSIRHYVKKFAWKNVETGDFRVAIEEATGRNLEWFFDQWVLKAGHPDLEASWTYDPRDEAVKLNLRQTQKVIGDTPVFRLNLEVRLWQGPGKYTDHVVRMNKPQESFFLPVGKRPVAVELDPDGWILKKLTFNKDAKEWAFQLENGTTANSRIEAAHELAKKPNDPATVPALKRALSKDPFWGVRRAAALALGDVRSVEARDILRAALSDKDSLVRRGAAQALGKFHRDAQAAAWLRRALARDRSDYVKASCVFALARLKDKQAFRDLKTYARRRSHNDVVAASALAGMACAACPFSSNSHGSANRRTCGQPPPWPSDAYGTSPTSDNKRRSATCSRPSCATPSTPNAARPSPPFAVCPIRS